MSLNTKQISPKTAVIAIAGLVVLLSVAIYLRANMGGGSTTAAPDTGAPPKPALKVSVQEGGPREAAKSQTAAAVAVSIADSDPVAIIAERNIFRPVSAPPSANALKGLGPLPPMAIAMLPPMPGAAPGGFGGGRRGGRGGSNLAFTGIVDTPDGTKALIENTNTAETKYVGIGDRAFGMMVTDVNSRSVSLDAGGRPMELAIGENKPDTPTGPAPGAPGAPGAPAAAGQQAGQPAQPASVNVAPAPGSGNPGGGGRRRRGGQGQGQ